MERTPSPHAGPLPAGMTSASAQAPGGRAAEKSATHPERRGFVRPIDPDVIARIYEGRWNDELAMRSHEPVRDFAERRAAVTLRRHVCEAVCWVGIAVLAVGVIATVWP